MSCFIVEDKLPPMEVRGNDRYIYTEYDAITDSIIFKIKADKALYGYVMCNTNDWKQNAKYKFERSFDDVDQNRLMSIYVPYKKLISKDQRYEYKVVLTYDGNHFQWMSDDGTDGVNSRFPQSHPKPYKASKIHAFTSYDEANDIVTFKVKSDEYDYGYVMCRANQWNYNNLPAIRDYKLVKDEEGFLTAKLSYDKKLYPRDGEIIFGLLAWQGVFQYKLYLHSTVDDNFHWMDADGRNVWGINSRFETKSNFSTDPWVISAVVDNEKCIKVFLKNCYTNRTGEKPKFEVSIGGVEYKAVKQTARDDGSHILIRIPLSEVFKNEPFDTRKPLYVRRKGASTYTKVYLRDILDKYEYKGDDLGVKFREDGISIKVWSPVASRAEVIIYEDYDSFLKSKLNGQAVEMDYDENTGIYSALIDKENRDRYYIFRFHFGDSVVRYAVDPYANSVGMNGIVGALTDIDMEDTKPLGYEYDKRPIFKNPEDAIIYEMHVRDFTIDRTWGGRPELAGKYLGVVEEETKVNYKGKEYATGFDHLKDLGITHVHFLPTYDFSSTDESRARDKDVRNWGYDPENYNVPEGSYSMNPKNPKSRIIEYRKMVMKLHKAGIRVINDVVYNHMASTENMDCIVPGYYFRSKRDGSYSDDSACGNAVESRRPMIRKFIIDSLKHWIKDYRTDGFRFDLMAILDTTTMNLIKKELKNLDPSLLIYGEPWMAAPSPLSDGKQTNKDKGIAYFNDVFRDAVRGDNHPEKSKGFVTGDFIKNPIVCNGINASGKEPKYMINYAEAHDDYTIWDQIEKNQNPDIDPSQYRQNIPEDVLSDIRVRKALLANAIMILSQGIPFFQGGSEILRTKHGDSNSFRSSDWVNKFDWIGKGQFLPVFNYYKGLIELRKAHPAFRLTSVLQVKKYQYVKRLQDKDNIIYQYLKHNAGGDDFKDIFILYNASDKREHINCLPKNGDWKVIANHERVDLKKPIEIISPIKDMGTGRYDFYIEPYSLMIMYNND